MTNLTPMDIELASMSIIYEELKQFDMPRRDEIINYVLSRIDEEQLLEEEAFKEVLLTKNTTPDDE